MARVLVEGFDHAADLDAQLARAEEARKAKRFDLVAGILNPLARSALEDAGWSADDRLKLARALKRQQLFGYARKVHGVLYDGAFCT